MWQTKAVKCKYNKFDYRLNILSLDEIIADNILGPTYEYWRLQCRGRPYPQRSDITPRGLKPLLRHAVLVAVLDGGADYEYRVIGDACVQAHGCNLQGLRWSELDICNSGYATEIRKIYDCAAQMGQPCAASCIIPRRFFTAPYSDDFVHCTFLCLPLGQPDSGINYVLIASHYSYDEACLP